MSRFSDFVSELFRRKVVRLLFAYIAILWLLAQGFVDLFPAFGLPEWSFRAFMILGIAAIPVIALVSWKYDLMPPLLVRDPKDVEYANRALDWAMRRPEDLDAGYITLTWIEQGQISRTEQYHRAVTIGRGPKNDIELLDRRVSRHHAVLWAEAGSWRVRDFDSANGTFIDQSRVTDAAVLPESCELRFDEQGPVIEVQVDKPAETVVS